MNMSEPRRGMLVRVGIDASYGRWNAPVDSASGEFVYVPIPEPLRPRRGHARPYRELKPQLRGFGAPLPPHLARANMHLDPDFEHLSYGDLGRKGRRLSALAQGDLVVFYAGLRDLRQERSELVYALIGLYVVDDICPATQIAAVDYHRNAHTRCVLADAADDVIIRAQPGVSGRLSRCLPIGSRRPAYDKPDGTPVYRVLPEILSAWGGLSNHDGYLQRSAVPPEFVDVARFYRWFQRQQVALLAQN